MSARFKDVSPADMGLQLAPHAVIRAARWPVDGLLSLGQGGATAVDHADRLHAELCLLWQHTLGHEAFRKALAVSHPALYGRLRQTPCPTTWNKAARQLIATLFRQWSRACWRTEPSGLWAGVGLSPWRARRPDSEGSSTVGRVAVAPHLQPFAAMLSYLSRTAPYVRRGRFKVHPSAMRESAGVWLVRVSVPTPQGEAGWGPDRTRRLRLRHIDAQAADQCIAALSQQGPLPYSALLRVATRCLRCEETAQALLDQLMAAQLLVGGLALPLAFETAWQALDRAALDLLPLHRAAWQAAVQDLKAQCHELEQHHAKLGAEAVWQRTRKVTERIEALAQQLDVGPLQWPRACLQWDAGLPAAVQLDPECLQLVQRALVLHEQYHRTTDPVVALDALYAQAHDDGRVAGWRRALVGQSDWDGAAQALRDAGHEGTLMARLRARRLGASAIAPAVPGAPFGALMVRVGRRRAVVQGLSHEPWLAYARFGALLGRHAPHAHPLHAWCDSALTLFSQSANVMLAQLRVACAPLANLMAQPRFSAARPLDLYGTTPGALPDAGLQLCHDGERRWLQSPTSARPVVALSATALDLGARDPLVERVLLTGWRYRPPVPAATWHDGGPQGQARIHAPDVVRQRAHWRLEGEQARDLAHAEPESRWARWQALARQHAWPALLTVSCDGEPAVLIPRDSVLAVEVMFRAPGSASATFDIEAPEDEFLITDTEGQRYATELILVFSRDQHAWNLRGQRMAAVPTDPGAAEAEACAVG